MNTITVKKPAWIALATLLIVILAAPVFLRPGSQIEYQRDTRTIWTQETAAGTKYNGFVYKSCRETFSFGYTWFSNIFNIVCDRRDHSKLCTLRMKSSSGYTSLGEKSLNLWKYVHQSDEAADIVVKIDDDTLIQKHVLEEMIDDFARKPCVLAGQLFQEGTYYWPLGRLYMFKKKGLPSSDSILWQAMNGAFKNAEDVQMGYLMNVTEANLACQLDHSKFWHATYDSTVPGWDQRVEIKFGHLSSSCDSGWF